MEGGVATTSMCMCLCKNRNSYKGLAGIYVEIWTYETSLQDTRHLRSEAWCVLHVCGWQFLGFCIQLWPICILTTYQVPIRSPISVIIIIWLQIEIGHQEPENLISLLLSASELLLSALWLVCPASTVQLQLQEGQLFKNRLNVVTIYTWSH